METSVTGVTTPAYHSCTRSAGADLRIAPIEVEAEVSKWTITGERNIKYDRFRVVPNE